MPPTFYQRSFIPSMIHTISSKITHKYGIQEPYLMYAETSEREHDKAHMYICAKVVDMNLAKQAMQVFARMYTGERSTRWSTECLNAIKQTREEGGGGASPFDTWGQPADPLRPDSARISGQPKIVLQGSQILHSYFNLSRSTFPYQMPVPSHHKTSRRLGQSANKKREGETKSSGLSRIKHIFNRTEVKLDQLLKDLNEHNGNLDMFNNLLKKQTASVGLTLPKYNFPGSASESGAGLERYKRTREECGHGGTKRVFTISLPSRSKESKIGHFWDTSPR